MLSLALYSTTAACDKGHAASERYRCRAALAATRCRKRYECNNLSWLLKLLVLRIRCYRKPLFCCDCLARGFSITGVHNHHTFPTSIRIWILLGGRHRNVYRWYYNYVAMDRSHPVRGGQPSWSSTYGCAWSQPTGQLLDRHPDDPHVNSHGRSTVRVRMHVGGLLFLIVSGRSTLGLTTSTGNKSPI